VPPLQILKRTRNNAGVLFEGVPDKAYLWQKKTEGFRMAQLNAALNGEFDAPKLIVRMKDEELCIPLTKTSDEPTDVLSWGQRLAHVFPSRWKTVLDADGNSILPNAPDVRPFTSKELFHLYQYDDFSFDDVASTTNKQTHHEHASESLQKCDDDLNLPKTATTTPFHNFALNWPGADSSVPPVTHTIGTASHGMDRWNDFVQNGGLSRYAKERNDARNNLKGVSRMSAFLNLGIVSIFRLVWEMKQHPSSGASGNTKWKTGADKFEEELVKFREHSYAHCFSRTDYDDITSLPRWSVQYLDHQEGQYTSSQLTNGTTQCQKWNAMQNYLVCTGELHNNVRMTWGKSVVEWGVIQSDDESSPCKPSQLTLKTLCFLNDRYGLDGLSPPSYGGVLWCMGWTDKSDSNGGVSTKPAYRYRMAAEDFEEAKRKLLTSSPRCVNNSDMKGKRQPSIQDMMKTTQQRQTNFSENKTISSISSGSIATHQIDSKKRKTIDSFFHRKAPKK
jgi:hypothetical protein